MVFYGPDMTRLVLAIWVLFLDRGVENFELVINNRGSRPTYSAFVSQRILCSACESWRIPKTSEEQPEAEGIDDIGGCKVS